MKEKNNNFEYMHEEVSLTKSIFKMYKNGNFIDGIKIWLCNFFRETTYNICFSYGNNIGNDNSLNEQLTYSITEDNELKLKYSFSSSFIDNNLFKANEIVNNIWESHVKKVITRN
jgi:hypothetical protein